ncbi:DarT ssDNA thymidine ADP-ribosyltransferase family protein [Azospirillum argentinense]|uniref:DarT ssDNA thymidine ADP-ribosyltransferase family protein n=1 Tax=Azospirillum argentinense TaxID=2970906 RepID=A0ABW8V899_9PROT
MGISIDRVQRHINESCAALRNFAQNANWPRYLFHAAHVQTAVDILRCGYISPRADLGVIAHDVANQGALANNEIAHHYARLYFRPKNRFHFRTEGIKCLTDPYRYPCHMSVPIMLAFDAASVLTAPETAFTDRNFAHQIVPGHDEAYFDQINFNDVYHDRPTSADRNNEIQDRRMAEVVFPGNLTLEGHLRFIICRSVFDRDTLIYLLGPTAAQYRRLMIVEQVRGSTFFHKGLYIKSISVSGGRLHVGLKPPDQMPTNGRYDVAVTRIENGQHFAMAAGEIDANIPAFNVTLPQKNKVTHVGINLEGVLAYCGPITTEESSIF